MRKNNQVFCYWMNNCGNYTCCHNCSSKTCIYRCKDNINSCKFKININKNIEKHYQYQKTTKEDNNKKDFIFNILPTIDNISEYQKIVINNIPNTIIQFSSMIKIIYKLKPNNKDNSTIYCVDLFDYCVINNIKTISAFNYIALNSKLRKIKKLLKNS